MTQPSLDLSIHENVIFATDFISESYIHVYLVDDKNSYKVYIEDRDRDFVKDYPMTFDALFGFEPPEVFWTRIIHDWKRSYYEEAQQPIENWENEGGALCY